MSLAGGHRAKEKYINDLFSSIADRYDLLNSLLSFNRDKYWRARAVKETRLGPGGKGLDVCCGTGMFTLEQARAAGPDGSVIGLDFCEKMLEVARKNIKRSPFKENIKLVLGNALDLPFEDDTFDCATIGFALRNVSNIERAVSEMARVVKPGGRVVSLELAKPSRLIFKEIYYFYFYRIVPVLGYIAGRKGPYKYLPHSLKSFPHQKQICKIFTGVGLEKVHFHELSGGIVAVHTGTKVASK